MGDLRLRRPQTLNAAFPRGTYKATEYSKFVRWRRGLPSTDLPLTANLRQCPGVGGDDWPYEQSEDCLYLNVVRPAGTGQGDKLPVGLWIYGGAQLLHSEHLRKLDFRLVLIQGGYQYGGSGDVRCAFIYH